MAVMNTSSGRSAYGVREFYLDNFSEFAKIAQKDCRAGSAAYIIGTGDVYILNNQNQWILQGDNGGVNPPIIDKDTVYVWDGGDIEP